MAKHLALVRDRVQPEIPIVEARVIDIRTRQPWRAPAAPTWPFLLDMLITFLVVLLGSWLFHKMRGG